ncbi:MAG: BatD family protein, partial [Anaerolineae bacterium]|nr:BatD family protein [Anaerolineae bacterium]
MAQAPVTAEVDRSTLSTDEQLLFTISVKGDILTMATPDLAALTDFAVISSSTATQVSIINGQLTSEGRFIYRLQPLRAGTLVIPPINVEFEGQLHQTQPFEIEVLPGTAPAAPSGQDIPSTEAPSTLSGQNFFVEAEVDNPSPYLGEQIIYTFRLYQAANFLGQPDYQPPAFIDFWGQTTLSQPTYRTQADGRDYLVTEIRTALFPANIGSVTIAPAKFVIPGGLFEPDVVLDTEPVTVNVKSWPDGAPEEFNGAIGQFEMKTFLEEQEGKVNEPLTLIIEIEGAGNIEILNEPALPELQGWRLFDSEVSTTTEVRDDVVYGTRRFKRLIVPSKPGRQTLPSITFSYYDPQAEAYQTLVSDPISINILAGDSESGFQPVADPDDQSTVLSVNDIRHI